MKFSALRFYRGSNFPFFPIDFEWALQQWSATALPACDKALYKCPLYSAVIINDAKSRFITCKTLPEDSVICWTDVWTADRLSTRSRGSPLACWPLPFACVGTVVSRDFTDCSIACLPVIIESMCPAIDFSEVCAFDNISFSKMLAIRSSPPNSSIYDRRPQYRLVEPDLAVA